MNELEKNEFIQSLGSIDGLSLIFLYKEKANQVKQLQELDEYLDVEFEATELKLIEDVIDCRAAFN